MQQCIDERVFLVAGGGMHDQAGGLVDNEQRFVLKQNIEWNFFRLRLGGSGFRPVNFNLFTRVWRMCRLHNFAIDANMALFNQPLHCAARDGGKFSAQKRVEPLGWERFFNDEIFRARRHPQIAPIFADSFLRELVKFAEKKFFISMIRQASARVHFSK